MKHTMQQAAAEIRALRRENEILRAKVETMELFACALHAQLPSGNRGMSPDIAWALDREVEKLDGLPDKAAA